MKPNQPMALRRESSQIHSPDSHNQEIDRLLAAAVVNHKFRTLLLADPSAALSAGYNGDTFQLSSEETKLLQSIHAATLQDFAAQLVEAEYAARNEETYSPNETSTAVLLPINVRVRL